jgi:Flp pilus assembly protein TadD
VSAQRHVQALDALHEQALAHLRRDDFRGALALCRLVLALAPSHPAEQAVRLTLALAYRELGRREDADRVLRRRSSSDVLHE